MRFFICAILCFMALEGTDESFFFAEKNSAFYNNAKNQKLLIVFLSAKEGAKVALDWVGLSDTYFYEIAPGVKQQSAEIYNEDIDEKVFNIKQYLKSLGNKKSANFVSQTLKAMNQAVNQLIVDSSADASTEAAYANIQAIVDAFDAGFAKTLGPKREDPLVVKAVKEAENALQQLAKQIEVYIAQLNLLEFHSSSGSQKIVSSNLQSVLSLGKFVESCALSIYLTNN